MLFDIFRHLGRFGATWDILLGSDMFWDVLRRFFGQIWDVSGHFKTFGNNLWRFVMFRDILGHFWTFLHVLGQFGMFLDVLGHFGKFWEVLVRFRMFW